MTSEDLATLGVDRDAILDRIAERLLEDHQDMLAPGFFDTLLTVPLSFASALAGVSTATLRRSCPVVDHGTRNHRVTVADLRHFLSSRKLNPELLTCKPQLPPATQGKALAAMPSPSS